MRLAFAQDVATELGSEPDRAAVSRRAFARFDEAVRRWGLDLERRARLLNVSLSTLQRLGRSAKAAGVFPIQDPDHLLRMSLVANIARDLSLSLGDGDDVAWLRARNADLDGRPPLEVMTVDELPGMARVFLLVRDWTLGR